VSGGFNQPFTLHRMAEMGYVMGLSTIAEVAIHIECHYDAYWLIEEVNQRSAELAALTAGHENDSIDLYLTADEKRKIDDELSIHV